MQFQSSYKIYRDRQSDRKTDTQTERDRETGRNRGIETERQRHTHRDIETDTQKTRKRMTNNGDDDQTVAGTDWRASAVLSGNEGETRELRRQRLQDRPSC